MWSNEGFPIPNIDQRPKSLTSEAVLYCENEISCMRPACFRLSFQIEASFQDGGGLWKPLICFKERSMKKPFVLCAETRSKGSHPFSQLKYLWPRRWSWNSYSKISNEVRTVGRFILTTNVTAIRLWISCCWPSSFGSWALPSSRPNYS